MVQISIAATDEDDFSIYNDFATFLIRFDKFNVPVIRFTEEEFKVKMLRIGVAEDWALPPIDPESSTLDHIEFEPEYEIRPYLEFNENSKIIYFDGREEIHKLEDKFYKLTIKLVDIHGEEKSYIQTIGFIRHTELDSPTDAATAETVERS